MIPTKVLEQHIAIIGKTGSGKTITAKGIVEHLLRKGERVCIIDPVSAWWGLRSDASGKGSGFPVVIFGGHHGDVEIGGSHGAAVAEIVATSKTPTIIDLKRMSVKDRTSFFTAFSVAIMQMNQGILHMVIDEAHLFAPKGRVNSNQAGEMLSETNNLVTGGRGIGLRFILLTQRPAKLHNDCLASIETLIAQRLTLPADRDAAEAWMKECASPEKGKEILASLPKLKTGEGWLWSPELDILERKTFPMITTFDSSNPKNLNRQDIEFRKIDLHAVKSKLDKAATDVVNNDPVQLRRLLSKAQQEASAFKRELAEAANRPISRPGHSDPEVLKREFERGAASVKKILGSKVSKYAQALHKTKGFYLSAFDAAFRELDTASSKVAAIEFPVSVELDQIISEAVASSRSEPSPVPAPRAANKPTRVATEAGNGSVSGLKRHMLTALAQHGACSQQRLATLSGTTINGHFKNELGSLRTAGYISPARVTPIEITDSGAAALGHWDPLPVGEELQQWWLLNLGSGIQSKILSALIKRRGMSTSMEELAEDCGTTVSGHFKNELGALRTKGLISPARTPLAASEHLFDE